MKNTTKHSRFLLMLCALICALSIGLVGCTTPQTGDLTSDSQEDSLTTSEPNASIEKWEPSIDLGDDEDPETEEQMLFIVAPTEEVHPYIQDVRNYLEAGPGANVSDYYHPVTTQAAPVQIKWKYNGLPKICLVLLQYMRQT